MKINSNTNSTKLLRNGRAAHIQLGRKGEKYAAEMLKSKGFSIICRNWRAGSGEIDIIARDGRTIVFTEVKTRRLSQYRNSEPRDNLRPGQIRRIRYGARKYLRKICANDNLWFRFDLIEVWLYKQNPVRIFHHQKCFSNIKIR